MVELQETLSFDDQILPLLLKEREKHNGRLTEEGTGTVNTLSVNRISYVKMRRWRSEQGFGLIFICLHKIDADSLKKKLEARFVGQERDYSIIVTWNDASPGETVSTKKSFVSFPVQNPWKSEETVFKGKCPFSIL